MKDLKQRGQTDLSAEKFFLFRVDVYSEERFIGSTVFTAHDSKEAKGMMIDKLTDVFFLVNEEFIEIKVQMLETLE